MDFNNESAVESEEQVEIEEISVPSNKGKGDNGFWLVTQESKAFYE